MNGVAIALGLFVTSALIVYIVWPWRAAQRDGWASVQPKPAPKTQRETLAERRETILTMLRDLDFDYAVAKVTKEDYESLRHPLLVEVAGIITQLDEEQATAEADLDARIEAEVLSVRQALHAERSQNAAARVPNSNGTCPACGWVRRPDALYCVDCGTKLSPLCPQCGQAARPADLFCADCGAKLVLALS